MSPEDDFKIADVSASTLSPEQARLVEEKVAVLRQARDLQTKLATTRAELSRIDEAMIKADFKLPVLACW